MGELLWDWTEGFIRNGVVNKNLDNTSTGLPDSGTEWCINRAPDSHCKDPGFRFLGGKPLSTFLGFLPLSLMKDCFGGGIFVGFLSSWTKWLDTCLFLLNSKTGEERFTV